MDKVGISIEEWCALAKEGTDIPVEITLAGTSMEPLIRMNRDKVVIVPPDGNTAVGDIVLFRRNDGAYVVHRVYRINGDQVVTLGDNCENPDKPISRDRILGKVVRIKRGNKIIDADSDRQRFSGRVKMKFLPLRKKYLHLKYVIRKNTGGRNK